MNKKITILFLGIIVVFSFLVGSALTAKRVFASEKEVNIYFFWGQGCPHCAKEKPFLEKLEQNYPQVKVYDFEVWYNSENRDLLIEVGKKLNADISGVPFTVIGDQYIIGYYNDATTGKEIENKVKYCLENKCPDPVGKILGLQKEQKPEQQPQQQPEQQPEQQLEQQEEKPEVINTEKEIKIYFFWTGGCPLCSAEKEFLEKIKTKYPNLQINSYNLTKDKEREELFKKTLEEFSVETFALPFTVIGKQYFIGWHSEEKTGKLIEEAIECALKTECPDIVGSLITSITPENKPSEKLLPEKIKLPLFGEIETKNLSLPLLSVVLGGLDGFNPCAMWTLLFLISLLLGMKDRKRMWVLGSAFIAASAAVYFLFMAAWLNLLLFIGFIVWIRVIIGLMALGSGIYNLREFFVNKQSSCKVTGDEKKQKVFEKLKAITQKRQFWLALVGIIILAGAVNLVELICSAGLPVVFTQILALSNLAKWQYYLYMLLYIFVFMLDDLFVFFAAMLTLQMTGITTKYTRFSHLIGGILMAIIGILLIFKPEWLMFG